MKVFQITFEVLMKAGNYWRRILRMPDIGACSLFEMESKVTLVKYSMNHVAGKISWIPGKFYGNQTILEFPDPKTASREEDVKFQQVESSGSCLNFVNISTTLAGH
jgi:hypothetical protein